MNISILITVQGYASSQGCVILTDGRSQKTLFRGPRREGAGPIADSQAREDAENWFKAHYPALAVFADPISDPT